jgi:hypothetical protein
LTEGAFDPLRALRTLTRHEVRFVVIGGLGARLYGSPSVTNDTDVCYERSPANLERLAAALRQLHAELRGADRNVPFQLDGTTLVAGDHFTFTTDAGNLDILGRPAGVAGFDALEREATVFRFDGLAVPVASIEDLISMKRAAGRPKDLIEVEVLGALRDEIANQDREPGSARPPEV